jgi:hypothetical protein
LPKQQKSYKWTAALGGLGRDFLATFGVVRSLTAAINQASEDEIEINPLVVEAAVIWIRSRLSATGTIEGDTELQNMHVACCLGIQIYLTTIIDQSEEHGLDPLDLISELRGRSNHIDLRAVQSPFVLWIMFFAGIAASHSVDRSWFITLLRYMIRGLDICDWDSLRAILQSFSWVESKHGDLGRLLWNATVPNDTGVS